MEKSDKDETFDENVNNVRSNILELTTDIPNIPGQCVENVDETRRDMFELTTDIPNIPGQCVENVDETRRDMFELTTDIPNIPGQCQDSADDVMTQYEEKKQPLHIRIEEFERKLHEERKLRGFTEDDCSLVGGNVRKKDLEMKRPRRLACEWAEWKRKLYEERRLDEERRKLKEGKGDEMPLDGEDGSSNTITGEQDSSGKPNNIKGNDEIEGNNETTTGEQNCNDIAHLQQEIKDAVQKNENKLKMPFGYERIRVKEKVFERFNENSPLFGLLRPENGHKLQELVSEGTSVLYFCDDFYLKHGDNIENDDEEHGDTVDMDGTEPSELNEADNAEDKEESSELNEADNVDDREESSELNEADDVEDMEESSELNETDNVEDSEEPSILNEARDVEDMKEPSKFRKFLNRLLSCVRPNADN